MSSSDPSPPPPPPPPVPLWRRSLFWTISGVAVAIVGVVVAVLQLQTAGGSGPSPSTASPRPSDASCVARAIPGAARAEARPLVAGVQLDEAAYLLRGLNLPESEPQIEAAGRIEGVTLEQGYALQLFSWGDPDTRDMLGNPGDGRYYYVGSFANNGACWSVGPGRACYVDCEGITIRYNFATAPDAALPELRLMQDGFSADDLRRLGVERVGEFSVPILP